MPYKKTSFSLGKKYYQGKKYYKNKYKKKYSKNKSTSKKYSKNKSASNYYWNKFKKINSPYERVIKPYNTDPKKRKVMMDYAINMILQMLLKTPPGTFGGYVPEAVGAEGIENMISRSYDYETLSETLSIDEIYNQIRSLPPYENPVSWEELRFNDMELP